MHPRKLAQQAQALYLTLHEASLTAARQADKARSNRLNTLAQRALHRYARRYARATARPELARAAQP